MPRVARRGRASRSRQAARPPENLEVAGGPAPRREIAGTVGCRAALSHPIEPEKGARVQPSPTTTSAVVPLIARWPGAHAPSPIGPTVRALRAACLRVARRRPSHPVTEAAVRSLPEGAATALVVAALVGVNVSQHLLHTAWWLAPVVAGALLVFARCSGLTWSQLGLSGDRLGSGLRWGLGAIAVVAFAYLVGVLLPVTRSAFLDSRYHLPVSGAVLSAFVVIPVGTVLLEEIAFRSVLWGMLSRHISTWKVLLATSGLFGLWHILPSLHLASANTAVSSTIGGVGNALVIAATVAFTALGGVVAGELRRRSGSVLASAGMHWATNALGVLFGLVAWYLVG